MDTQTLRRLRGQRSFWAGLLLACAVAILGCAVPQVTLPPPPTATPFTWRLTQAAATPVSSAVPPASLIAFVSNSAGNNDIYVMKPDGSERRSLTSDVMGDAYPAWSPDGRLLAFASTRTGRYQIFAMNADGSNQIQLTHDDGDNWWPAWSPDGNRIAFTSNRNGSMDIYLMDADGSNETLLTDDPADDSQPAWSHDGKRIAFTSRRDGRDAIYVMDADGANPAKLNFGIGGEASNAAWEPGDKRLAFAAEWADSWDVWVEQLDGTNGDDLTEAPGNDFQPDWSPDGQWIVFKSYRPDQNEFTKIYIMRADGYGLVQLTSDASADTRPVWQPIP